jgi:YfiH family protein
VSSAYAADGSPSELNLGLTAADSRENVIENRRLLAQAITGDRQTPLVTVRQVHCNRSVVAGPIPEPDYGVAGGVIVAGEADGILTDRPGLLLGIQTADCIPVLIADPVRRVVGAFHSGWRGTVERIVELGVAQMQTAFGSNPADLLAAIGPGIGPCCYTVGDEVLDRFSKNFDYAAELFSRRQAESGPDLRIDLVEANRRQLLAAGLGAEAISTVGGCTSCQPELFFSHRAAQGHAGRMMSVIGIR